MGENAVIDHLIIEKLVEARLIAGSLPPSDAWKMGVLDAIARAIDMTNYNAKDRERHEASEAKRLEEERRNAATGR